MIGCLIKFAASLCRLDVSKKFLEGAEALAQDAQSSCGWPWIPGNVQGQAGWGLEQPGTVEVVPAHGREWNWMSFKVPSSPNRFITF